MSMPNPDDLLDFQGHINLKLAYITWLSTLAPETRAIFEEIERMQSNYLLYGDARGPGPHLKEPVGLIHAEDYVV